ncbi:MAG: cation transporter [Anaerovoracaceae bacterium]|jgi:copper chaperone CopZ|nr:cation transporter [Anaerovoracaceae bacterium]
MKRSFKLENLCCANCAAKIETSINKLDGVEASISFMTQRLNIEAEDMDSAVEQAQGIISKIEPDCVIVR